MRPGCIWVGCRDCVFIFMELCVFCVVDWMFSGIRLRRGGGSGGDGGGTVAGITRVADTSCGDGYCKDKGSVACVICGDSPSDVRPSVTDDGIPAEILKAAKEAGADPSKFPYYVFDPYMEVKGIGPGDSTKTVRLRNDYCTGSNNYGHPCDYICQDCLDSVRPIVNSNLELTGVPGTNPRDRTCPQCRNKTGRFLPDAGTGWSREGMFFIPFFEFFMGLVCFDCL